MVGDTLTESWLGTLWKSSRKTISWQPEGTELGILAFEVSRLMSKVVNLWRCLTDRQIHRLKEEIANSVGIQKLISEDNQYVMDLVLAEILDTFGSVSKSIAALGKKCVDPTYHNLENVFGDPYEIDPKWDLWVYRLKKMERKIKKMDKFVATTEQMYQEIDVLAELEQSLRRMQAGADIGRNRRVKLLEFQQKVVWQRQEVKNLRESSPWVRSYDYIVRLLLRSLFTIIERIKYVYGNNDQIEMDKVNNIHIAQNDRLIRNNSITPSESGRYEINHPVLGRSFSNLNIWDSKSKSKKFIRTKTSRFIDVGLTGSCVASATESPVVEIFTPSCGSSFRANATTSHRGREEINVIGSFLHRKTKSLFNSKRKLLITSPSTLGFAGLALHYANVIILIEKLASAPHLISLDARDDLYYLLPATIRSSLRAKLKIFSRNPASSVYDTTLAAEWRLAVMKILDWLSPLANNTKRWQSERNFERQRLVYGSHVLLVQTLQFANQLDTEAAIVELLMGLNYLYRFGREIHENRCQYSSCGYAYEPCSFPKDNMCHNMIGHTA